VEPNKFGQRRVVFGDLDSDCHPNSKPGFAARYFKAGRYRRAFGDTILYRERRGN
jgi:hypothetical protein